MAPVPGASSSLPPFLPLLGRCVSMSVTKGPASEDSRAAKVKGNKMHVVSVPPPEFEMTLPLPSRPPSTGPPRGMSSHSCVSSDPRDESTLAAMDTSLPPSLPLHIYQFSFSE